MKDWLMEGTTLQAKLAAAGPGLSSIGSTYANWKSWS